MFMCCVVILLFVRFDLMLDWFGCYLFNCLCCIMLVTLVFFVDLWVG